MDEPSPLPDDAEAGARVAPTPGGAADERGASDEHGASVEPADERGTVRSAAGLPAFEGIEVVAVPEDAGWFARRYLAARNWGVTRAAEIEARWPQTAMGWELYRRFRRLNGTVLAGHLAFRLFLVLLPLLVLLVGVAGLAVDSGVNVGSQMSDTVDMSTALSSSVAQGLQDAQRGRWGLFLTGAFGLVLTSLSLLSAVYYGFAQAWDVRVEKIEHRWSTFARFLGAFLLFVLFFLATSRLRKAGFLLSVTGSAVAIGAFALAILGLSIAMPRRATSWIWLLPGSIFSAVAYLVLQFVMVYYLPDKLARSSQLYGGLGVAAALLFVLLLLSDVVIVSAFVNAVWWDHFHPDGDVAEHERFEVVHRIEHAAGRLVDRVPFHRVADGDGTEPDDATSGGTASGGSERGGGDGAAADTVQR